MISIILTGHGEFASGLYQSLKMITGEQDYFQVIPYNGEALSDYQKKLADVFIREAHRADGLLVLTDLLGGTPYRAASHELKGYQNSLIITGVNLPLLIESTQSRLFIKDAHDLADHLVTKGQEAIEERAAEE